MTKIFPNKTFSVGGKKEISPEEHIENINFTIHKFTNRKRPSPQNVIIFPHFSEFGSEIVESLYCVPMLMNSTHKGKYSIVMGWQGRSYLYKHLVDEFWEIKEEHQWLRDYCRCFHHESKNLKKTEKEASIFGKVLSINDYALLTLNPRLLKCPNCSGTIIYTEDSQKCLACSNIYPRVGIYHDIIETKKNAVWTPDPGQEKIAYVKSRYLKPNSIGVTARFRTCYGRNLPKEFYERLIYLLEDLGYHPIWIGEKETTLRCPFSRITDYSITKDALDLETTLALVKQLKFTVQFWTASTRLAGLMATPYLIFESPDQIWGGGQEGSRMNLCTKGERKLVIAHYFSALENQIKALDLVKQAVLEMEKGNFNDIIGMVENDDIVANMRKNNLKRVGTKI